MVGPYFISRHARELLNEFSCLEWETAFAIENALLDHKPEVLRGHLLQSLASGDLLVTQFSKELKALRHTLDLAPVRNAFELLCGSFLVQDYSLFDLRKIADMCIHFPYTVLEPVAARCRAQGIYTISYLSAALQSEGGGAINVLRREARLDDIARRGVPVPLPAPRKPTALLTLDLNKEAAAAEADRKLEQIREGLNAEL